MSGLLLPIERYTVTAASASGYLTVSSSVGIYPSAVFWLTLTNGSIPRQVEVTEVNGSSVGVRFVPEPGMPQTNYGRSNVSAYNAGGYLYQGEQILYRSSEIPAQSPMVIGLQAYWNLENDGNDGLGVSNMTATDITFNGSEAVFGTNGTLVTPASALLDVMTDLTISGWFRPTQSADYYAMVSHMVGGGGPNGVNYDLIFFPHSQIFMHSQGDTGPGGPFLSLNTWAHIVVTRDTAGNVEFFKDGASYSTGTGPAPYSKPTATTQIGSRADNYSHWIGSIKRVGIWGRILSGAEIAFLYNAGSGISYPF